MFVISYLLGDVWTGRSSLVSWADDTIYGILYACLFTQSRKRNEKVKSNKETAKSKVVVKNKAGAKNLQHY